MQPSQIKAEVEKRVIKDKSETKNSFGWILSDTSHTWYANGDEVMKASQSGLEVTGKVTATSGSIAGWDIQSQYLVRETTTSRVRLNAFTSTYLTNNAISVATKDASATDWNTQFSVAYNGKVTAKNAEIEGKVTATSGSIGGWEISSTSLKHDVGLYHVLMQAPSSPTDSGVAFRVQAANDAGTATESKFYVTYGGKMYSKNAEVTGKITATSGVIGGCTIENNVLSVPAANITGKIDVGKLSTDVVTQYTATYQYYVSSSATSKSGGSWVNNLDSWSAGKYIWRRTQTVTHYSNGTTRTVTSPNTAGVYDAYLTTKVGTDGTGVAQKRVQIIYRSYTAGSIPSATAAWVEAVYASDNETGKQNTWTSVRPAYSSTYPAIYTAQQTETLDGTVTTNAHRLEANTTIIDGNNIVAGSISASKIAVDDLSAFSATIGGWSISATGLNKKTSNYNVEINSPVSPTDSSKAFHVQYANTAGGTLASKFYVRYDGYMYAENAYISGTVYATAGKIGDCNISNGKLVVAASNLPSDVVMYSYSETQYRLSNSSTSLTGSGTGYTWSTNLPTWTSGKYIWTRTRNVTKKASAPTTEVETFRPSEDGVYDKSLTEALQKATNAQTTASDASSSAGSSAQRTQTIYFAKSKNDSSYPSAYTTWATAKTKYYLDPNTGSNVEAGVQGEWTSVRPLYTKDYPSIYIATQTQTVTQYANGTGTVCSCTTPQLEVSTTVIDGSHILTGSIDASKITVAELSALNATIGGFHIEATSGSTAGHIYYGKNSLYSSNSGVYIGTDGIALGANVSSNSVVSNGGDFIYEEVGGTGTGDYYPSSSVGFKVTASGEVTASSIQIQGGSININNNFRVTASGDLYAASGWFSGNVTAQNILAGQQYDPYSGQWTDAGTFHGNGITTQSVTTGQTDSGINTSLGYADFSNAVFSGTDTALFTRVTNLVVSGYHLSLYSETINGTPYLILGFNQSGPSW